MLDFLRNAIHRREGGAEPSDAKPHSTAAHSKPAEPVRRRSNGLRHFFETMPSSGNREILDLGGISEANIEYLSGHGGKIHTVDLIDCYDSGVAAGSAERYSLEAAHGFVDQYLNFARTQFDAILAWDSLEFLDSDALHLTIPRLAEILRPGGVLLAFFHTQARGETVPLHRYSIQGVDELALAPRKERAMPNTFNNRSLERLFQDFDSVKFFLTRDNLREVIVTR